MNTYQMVRSEHLNHYGKLFGGYMLLWVDEMAWLTAARDFPGCNLVTRSMEKIDFNCPVESGSILRFNILPERIGNTSVTYEIHVFADAPGAETEKLVFSNKVTFVNLDSDGKTSSLPPKIHPLCSEKVCE